MAKKDEIRRKPRHTIGSFFFGVFMGFVLTICLIAGTGFFVYKKVSVNWVNKTFKTNIDLGYEELNNATVGEVVNKAIYITSNLNSYSLCDFESDFGVNLGTTISGIDISDLKIYAITELPDAVKNKMQTISADEIKELINLTEAGTDSVSKIFNHEQKFYVSFVGSEIKLYHDAERTKLVTDFDYSYDSATETLKIKRQEISPVRFTTENIKIKLRYLPLVAAINAYTGSMGDNLTIADLADFGINLPNYIVEGNETKTLNEMQSIIDDLRIAEILGYYYNESVGKVYVSESDDTEVQGIIGTVSKLKVGELGTNLQSTIDGMTLLDVLEYRENDGKVYDKDDEEVTGIIAAVVKGGTTVGNLTTKINNLTLADVIDSNDLNSGILSLIPSTTPVTGVSNALSTAFEGATIDTLVKAGIISIDDYETKKNQTVRDTGKTLKEITIQDIITAWMTTITLD